jgi:hypothetical protein
MGTEVMFEMQGKTTEMGGLPHIILIPLEIILVVEVGGISVDILATIVPSLTRLVMIHLWKISLAI